MMTIGNMVIVAIILFVVQIVVLLILVSLVRAKKISMLQQEKKRLDQLLKDIEEHRSSFEAQTNKGRADNGDLL